MTNGNTAGTGQVGAGGVAGAQPTAQQAGQPTAGGAAQPTQPQAQQVAATATPQPTAIAQTAVQQPTPTAAAPQNTFRKWGRRAGYSALAGILLSVGTIGTIAYFNRAGDENGGPKGNNLTERVTNGKPSTGQVIFEGVIDNWDIKYVEGGNYNVLFAEIEGEKYALYDLRNKRNIDSDFSDDKLEKIVVDAKRRGTLRKEEANENTDYGKKMKKTFDDWDNFYFEVRKSIVRELADKREKEVEKKYKEAEKAYNLLDKLGPEN